jgi:hypothetical protein
LDDEETQIYRPAKRPSNPTSATPASQAPLSRSPISSSPPSGQPDDGAGSVEDSHVRPTFGRTAQAQSGPIDLSGLSGNEGDETSIYRPPAELLEQVREKRAASSSSPPPSRQAAPGGLIHSSSPLQVELPPASEAPIVAPLQEVTVHVQAQPTHLEPTQTMLIAPRSRTTAVMLSVGAMVVIAGAVAAVFTLFATL